MAKYTIGLHYDTHAVRALVVSVANGREVGTSAWTYSRGKDGVIVSDDPHLARQHPADYIKGTETAIKRALAAAKRQVKTFTPKDVIGIGVAAAASTPLPIDRDGKALALQARFAKEPAAMAWVWKDHTAVAEAEEITNYTKKHRPRYLDKCGGTYSSESFFSKLLRCLRATPKVFHSAYTWVENADWIPAMLTGTGGAGQLTIGICAAGHKAMYSRDWGGYPDVRFLSGLDPALGELRKRLPERAYSVDHVAGGLTKDWARRTGLPADTPVAVGAIDSHLGAVGAGVKPGRMIKHIAAGACDLMTIPNGTQALDIPWTCGLVKDSILPGYIGLEAGQAAIGDLFDWFAGHMPGGSSNAGSHQALTAEAGKTAPGASGLLALDWHNGNRSILCDPQLTGLVLGQTLNTTPGQVFRTLMEATAFGALTIVNRLEDHHVNVDEIVCCGPIAQKNPLLMQIYADVTGRAIKISRSAQTCALGAAIAAAVAAGEQRHGYPNFQSAQEAMTGQKTKVFKPDTQAHNIYRKLYLLYRMLHDAFGTTSWHGNLHNVMKELIAIRRQATG